MTDWLIAMLVNAGIGVIILGLLLLGLGFVNAIMEIVEDIIERFQR